MKKQTDYFTQLASFEEWLLAHHGETEMNFACYDDWLASQFEAWFNANEEMEALLQAEQQTIAEWTSYTEMLAAEGKFKDLNHHGENSWHAEQKQKIEQARAVLENLKMSETRIHQLLQDRRWVDRLTAFNVVQ